MFDFFGYLMLFAIGAVGGWCVEIVFRRFFSAKKWINPGFLRGPYLPLYGFGTSLMFAVCSIPIEENWAKLLIIALAMTLIEYIAGLIFIKGLKIKLWDYSNRWGNLQGIICPLFSLLWGLVGAGFLYLLFPPLNVAFSYLAGHVWLLFPIGLFYGILIVDAAVSFNLSVKLRVIAKELRYAINYEKLKLKIWIESKKGSRRALFLTPFKTTKSIDDTVRELLEEEKNLSRQRAEASSTYKTAASRKRALKQKPQEVSQYKNNTLHVVTRDDNQAATDTE